MNNIIQGGSTYGFSEIFYYLYNTFEGHWSFLSDDMGLGVGTGLLIASFGARMFFMPIIIYSQMVGVK